MNEFARMDAIAAESAWRIPIFIAWIVGLGSVFDAGFVNSRPFKHWSHYTATAFLIAHACAYVYIAFDAAT